MQAQRPLPSTEPRLDAHLIDVATRHAQTLRSQAIDDTLCRLGGWLRRPFSTPAKAIMREQPCHLSP
jgi:hypothetical protein